MATRGIQGGAGQVQQPTTTRAATNMSAVWKQIFPGPTPTQQPTSARGAGAPIGSGAPPTTDDWMTKLAKGKTGFLGIRFTRNFIREPVTKKLNAFIGPKLHGVGIDYTKTLGKMSFGDRCGLLKLKEMAEAGDPQAGIGLAKLIAEGSPEVKEVAQAILQKLCESNDPQVTTSLGALRNEALSTPTMNPTRRALVNIKVESSDEYNYQFLRILAEAGNLGAQKMLIQRPRGVDWQALGALGEAYKSVGGGKHSLLPPLPEAIRQIGTRIETSTRRALGNPNDEAIATAFAANIQQTTDPEMLMLYVDAGHEVPDAKLEQAHNEALKAKPRNEELTSRLQTAWENTNTAKQRHAIEEQAKNAGMEARALHPNDRARADKAYWEAYNAYRASH